jgi:hypothetical protein
MDTPLRRVSYRPYIDSIGTWTGRTLVDRLHRWYNWTGLPEPQERGGDIKGGREPSESNAGAQGGDGGMGHGQGCKPGMERWGTTFARCLSHGDGVLKFNFYGDGRTTSKGSPGDPVPLCGQVPMGDSPGAPMKLSIQGHQYSGNESPAAGRRKVRERWGLGGSGCDTKHPSTGPLFLGEACEGPSYLLRGGVNFDF